MEIEVAPDGQSLQSPPSDRGLRPDFRTATWIALIMVLALVLRLPGLFTEFWLDEIWSWQLIREQIRSSLDVVTKARIDNNHPLNTLLMYLMGDQPAWMIYRVPSLLAGLGTAALAGRIGFRRGRPHALAAAAVMATSYASVVYSTEARGYELVMFFTLLSVDCLDQFFTDHRIWRCILFGFTIVLGCLSHPTFLITYAATLAWSIGEWIHSGNLRPGVKKFLYCHAFPLLFVPGYYLAYVLRMEIGGIEKSDIVQLLYDTFAFVMGLSSGEHTNVFAAIVGALLWLWTLIVVGRRWPRLLALFIPGTVVVPAILLVAANARGMTIFPRYFSPAIVLMLLGFGLAIGEFWRPGSRIGKWCFVGLLTLFVLANQIQVFRFSMIGRGRYLAALQYMLEHGDGKTITLSGDQEVRHLKLLTFYARYLPNGSRIHPVPWQDIAREWPQWYIISSLVDADVPPVCYIGNLVASTAPLEPRIPQRRYVLRRVYPYYGPSGTLWAVYERADD